MDERAYRFGTRPVREKTKIYAPDCLVLFDQSQLGSPLVYQGLKQKGTLVANTSNPLEETPHENLTTVGTLNATPIALEVLGVPAVSTCMLGAFAATTQWVRLDSILSVLPLYFKADLLDKNITCAERGFDETRVKRKEGVK